MIKLYLPKFWYRRELISYLLLPFSFVYRAFISLYRLSYKRLSAARFPVPIIVVGNITVGGTGKTPMVIGLVELLKKQGYNPGVISRGYGRKGGSGSVIVTAKSKADEVGDEALLIARRAACPVIVDNDRIVAAKKLLEVYKCNVIVSDDGLQHYKLPRYIEIALIDAEFEFGNKFCLPAGPLREPISRLNSVDFIVRNFNTSLPLLVPPGEYSMVLELTGFRNIKDPATVKAADAFKGQAIHAVAGIGMPEKFFKTLRHLNLDIIEHPFPDHHIFSSSDLSFENKTVIMTEKDGVKCEALAQENFWYVEVNAKLESRFVEELLDRLKNYHNNITNT